MSSNSVLNICICKWKEIVPEICWLANRSTLYSLVVSKTSVGPIKQPGHSQKAHFVTATAKGYTHHTHTLFALAPLQQQADQLTAQRERGLADSHCSALPRERALKRPRCTIEELKSTKPYQILFPKRTNRTQLQHSRIIDNLPTFRNFHVIFILRPFSNIRIDHKNAMSWIAYESDTL